jgi:hypothetical protein
MAQTRRGAVLLIIAWVVFVASAVTAAILEEVVIETMGPGLVGTWDNTGVGNDAS